MDVSFSGEDARCIIFNYMTSTNHCDPRPCVKREGEKNKGTEPIYRIRTQRAVSQHCAELIVIYGCIKAVS